MQVVLESALAHGIRHPVNLLGSGRTDAGVHAAGQGASFRTTCTLPAYKIKSALLSRLPPDVAIVRAREVQPDFHATKDAISKLYRYRIHAARGRPVALFSQRYTYHHWKPLDVERMRAGAKYFPGTRDFSAMAGAGCTRQTMVRTVQSCDVRREGDEITIDVVGKGFLYRQVRIMV